MGAQPVPDPNIIHNPGVHQILGAAIAVIPFSIAAVSVRFWARHYQGLPFRADDWLTIPSLAGNLAIAAVTLWSIEVGALGYLTPQPPSGTRPDHFMNPMIQIGKKVIWSVQIVQAVSLTCTKLSCLFFYRRIFYTGHHDAFHWISLSLIIICLLWGFTFFIAYLCTCGNDLHALWTDIYTLTTYCKAFLPMEVSFGVTDIAVDIVIFILPFVMVTKLHMSLSRKIATASMFFLGAFAIAAGLLRMVVLVDAVITAEQDYKETGTGANNGVVTAHVLWICIESTATLTASCLPSVYAPLRDLIRRIIGSPKRPSLYPAVTRSGQTVRWPPSWRSKKHDTLITDLTQDHIPMVYKPASTARIDSEVTANESRDSDRESLHPGQIRVEKTVEQTVEQTRKESDLAV